MRSSNRSADASRFLQLLLIAALVIVGRAPFLLHGDRFFDSDEAVEGLMAIHVLHGEHPAFLWGQHYKGVPEVYLAAAVATAVLSHHRQRKSFYYAGLVNSGLALVLIADRRDWFDKPAWAITLVSMGLAALITGFLLDASRRRQKE